MEKLFDYPRFPPFAVGLSPNFSRPPDNGEPPYGNHRQRATPRTPEHRRRKAGRLQLPRPAGPAFDPQGTGELFLSKHELGHAVFHLPTAAYASSPAGDYNAPLLQQEPCWIPERRPR